MKKPWELDTKIFEFAEPTTPCVYVLWGEDEERPNYVGCSENVFGRIGHHVAMYPARAIQRVEIITCVDKEHMCECEADIIKWYRPRWNLLHNI
jgi:excinuclease UvrABC nuclease subunit